MPAAPSSVRIPTSLGAVRVITRQQLEEHPAWLASFSENRKDHRYYAIVEDTILQGFDYRYFVIENTSGEVIAIQPFFIHAQDLLTGMEGGVKNLVARMRKAFPRLLTMRTLMIGCAAGEGHLDSADESRGRLIVE